MLALLVVGIPLPQGTKPSALAARQTDCATYGSISGDATEATWCAAACGANVCPEDKCKCVDGDAAPAPVTTEAAMPAAVPAAVPVAVPGAVPAAVPGAVPAAVPGVAVPGEADDPYAADEEPGVAPPLEGSIPGDGVSIPAEGAVPLPKGTKVYVETNKGDKTGDKNLPFDKLFIAYWGSDPHTPWEGQKGATMADALTEGYNVIAMSFADQFKADGTFGIDTNMCSGPQVPDHSRSPKGVDAATGLQLPHTHQCMPSKGNVSKAAGIPMDSWRYVLSFGGAAGPGPRMDEAGDESQEDTFVEGFVKTYMQYKADYGFDGLDMDVESSINSPVLRTFRKIYKVLHDKGELISMAPETPSLNPGEFPVFQAGATNSYAPLVDTTIIDHVSWVAPQMYNDGIPFEGDAVKYIQSLQASSKLDWDGQELEIKIPASKIVLGFPATQAAAPVHALPEWETPEGLLALYRSSPELMATRGVMTWSVGHDHSNGWKWIRAVRQIWA